MTADEILTHLRAHPEDAPAVFEGLRKFAEWAHDLVFPLIDDNNDTGSMAMVGQATPTETEDPIASWVPPWRIKAQVWADPPHTSWHTSFEDARTAVEAHLKANGWTVLPRRTPRLRWAPYPNGGIFLGSTDTGLSMAFVGPSEPHEGHPARAWGPPWFLATVGNTPPGGTRHTWHRTLNEARAHVEAYMTECGFTVETL